MKVVMVKDGKQINKIMTVDSKLLTENETIKEALYDEWCNIFNECICTLNESQSYCECDGEYGDNLEIVIID